MCDPTPVLLWSDLLPAPPELMLLDAAVTDRDELVATLALPRDVRACPRCGAIAPPRDWRTHTLRHLSVAGGACRVVWLKRLLVCDGGCGNFAQRSPSIAPGAVWTKAAARSAEAMSADNVPVDTTRKTVGVGWNTVMRAVAAAAGRVAPVVARRVGIDETVMVTGHRRYLIAMCVAVVPASRTPQGPSSSSSPLLVLPSGS